ncbi:phage conserved hypothetical protein BR0599 [Methylobacterium sp. 13MFTsu3.1M2]|nr:phage conserved hypothetical protein BR0599 [Methylobacterium sp. 13MFTsu3.1M2]
MPTYFLLLPTNFPHAHSLTAGCDKRLATCRDRFANAVNFQGFPHMPGNDAVMRAVPGSDPILDGGSLFR